MVVGRLAFTFVAVLAGIAHAQSVEQLGLDILDERRERDELVIRESQDRAALYCYRDYLNLHRLEFEPAFFNQQQLYCTHGIGKCNTALTNLANSKVALDAAMSLFNQRRYEEAANKLQIGVRENIYAMARLVEAEYYMEQLRRNLLP